MARLPTTMPQTLSDAVAGRLAARVLAAIGRLSGGPRRAHI